MLNTYFLGANTPEGFRSEYGSLQADPRIRKLLILKGGPGCGKSTLMKAVGQAAGELGLAVQRIPCSSDPDSLDGLVIPELGLALADGTAPHVLEPELCGCGANYVNLGQYYGEAALSAAAEELQQAREANQSCYGPAYACLRAAAEIGTVLRAAVVPALPADTTEKALRELLPKELPEGKGAGRALRCYLSAITPQGALRLPAGGRTVAISDRYGLGTPLTERLARQFRRAGHDVVLAMDPMAPDQLEGVLIPALDLGWVRVSPLFSAEAAPPALLRLDLDAAAEAGLRETELLHVRALEKQRGSFLREAVRYLAEAKRHHDALEALYRPAVDFAGVEAETQTIIRGLLEEV